MRIAIPPLPFVSVPIVRIFLLLLDIMIKIKMITNYPVNS